MFTSQEQLHAKSQPGISWLVCHKQLYSWARVVNKLSYTALVNCMIDNVMGDGIVDLNEGNEQSAVRLTRMNYLQHHGQEQERVMHLSVS